MTRRVASIVAVLALGLCAACGASGATAAPSSPATLGPSVVPSQSTGVAVPVDELLTGAGAADGQVVRVTGMLLADGAGAHLCSLALESYPPQCGGASVRLTGTVPQATVDLLDKTDDPTLKQAMWGWVVVTGTFSSSGASGEPTIEIAEVTLAEG